METALQTRSDPGPQPEMWRHLDAAISAVEVLHERLTVLEGRLDPLLTPEQDSPASESLGEVRKRVSGLSDRLMEHGQALRQAAVRVETLLERLEI